MVIEGFDSTRVNESFERTHFLPGVAFAWGFGGKDVPVDYGSKSLSNTPSKPTRTSTIMAATTRA